MMLITADLSIAQSYAEPYLELVWDKILFSITDPSTRASVLVFDINHDAMDDTILNVGVTSDAEGDFFCIKLSTGDVYYGAGSLCDTFSFNGEKGIRVRRDPCCMGNLVKHQWMIMDTIPLKPFLQICVFTSTGFPKDKSWIDKPYIVTIGNTLPLRCTPFVDDSTEYDELHQIGNTIINIEKNMPLIVLAIEKKNDEKWYFVATKDEYDRHRYDNDENNNYLLGWIKH